MLSAFGSLNKAPPTQVFKTFDGTTYYGIGEDGLTLSGNYEFQVLSGTVRLCGIELSAGCESSKHIVSAPVIPYPVITAVATSVNVSEESNENNTQDTKDSASLVVPPEIATSVSAFSAVIIVRPHATIPDISAIAPPYKSLFHYLRRVEDADSPRLIIPPSWQEIGLEYPAYIMLGPKNSGKSGLCRYICNRLVSSPNVRGRVFYLELDPGQPEYTPPGFLSLHEVHDLSFSPAFAHPNFKNVITAHYYGYVSPAETPHAYLAMCESLIYSVRPQLHPDDRLVVNTPGWTRGVGLELNRAIIGMVLPALILHMGPNTDFEDAVEVERVVQSPGSAVTLSAGGFSPADLRNLQHMLYFHQNDESHITEWTPYELNLGPEGAIRAFAVLNSESLNLDMDLGVCVEGTVVSINTTESVDENADLYLDPSAAADFWRASKCIGLGIVQSVDFKKRKMRLLTPVDPEELDLANKTVVLVRGRVQLPVWELYNKSLGSVSDVPWIETIKPRGVGASYTKFRRNIQR